MRLMIKIFFYCVLLCSFSSCGSRETNTSFLAHVKDTSCLYDLSEPSHIWQLPESLKEVSGNAWVNANHLLLIEDLHPDLYLVQLGKESVIEKLIPFLEGKDKKFDVEDVAVSGDTAYTLWSHGVIYQINNWKSNPSVQQWETGLSKENNTEGLCFDPASHNLLIACKNKSGDEDEKKSTRAIYQFDIVHQKRSTTPFLLIAKKDFLKKGYSISGFFPSAIAVHPKTHDVYILSTRETKAMAVYSYEGVLRSFQLINKALMPQPEGICFSDTGDLYITTEGKHGEPAKLFEFHCRKK
jgi:SdiA-regulated